MVEILAFQDISTMYWTSWPLIRKKKKGKRIRDGIWYFVVDIEVGFSLVGWIWWWLMLGVRYRMGWAGAVPFPAGCGPGRHWPGPVCLARATRPGPGFHIGDPVTARYPTGMGRAIPRPGRVGPSRVGKFFRSYSTSRIIWSSFNESELLDLLNADNNPDNKELLGLDEYASWDDCLFQIENHKNHTYRVYLHGSRGETLLKLWGSTIRITYTSRWEDYKPLMAAKNSEPLWLSFSHESLT